MPPVARFYGMVIKMYYQQNEHNPPHVHVIYNEYMGAIDIKTQKVMEGDLPKKALNMALEWVGQHRDELLEMWEKQEFRLLPPLE